MSINVKINLLVHIQNTSPAGAGGQLVTDQVLRRYSLTLGPILV